MFIRRCALPCLLLFSISATAGVTTETLAPGVFHDRYTLATPNIVNVIRMDLSRPEYKLRLGMAQRKRDYTAKEGVSVICPRYEAPGNHVIAGVNGSLFNVAATDYGISGGLIDASGYMQLANGDREMISINDARTFVIEKAVKSSAPVVTYADGSTANISNYMAIRVTNQLACYLSTWGPTTGTTNQGVEVIISNVSYPIKPQKQVSGVVTAIRSGAASVNNPIPTNGLVLSADSAAGTTLLSKVAVGDRIYFKASINMTDFYWSNLSLSGNGYILKGGAPVDAGTAPDPETVLAWNATNFFFMVVDGRSSQSAGMSWNDLASFLTNTVGATDAIAMDSGGSSEMWISGEGIVNTPSDGTERAVANAVMLVNEPTGTAFPVEDDFTSAGRTLNWDDKFTYAAVSAFSPTAPGGDGYVMTVKNVGGGGTETARVGDFGDTNYTVEAEIYCENRAANAGNGYEQCGIFARDNGNQAFTATSYSGNCYALIYRTDTGQLSATRIVNMVVTDFPAATPTNITVSGWHKFGIRCYDSKIQYLLDGAPLCTVTDTTFARGYFGIGYHDWYSSTSLIHGTRADNFKAFVEANPFGVAASLAIAVDTNGYPNLTITGTTGATYRVDAIASFPSTNWTALTNLTLPGSPYIYVDRTAGTNFAGRFYRVVLPE